MSVERVFREQTLDGCHCHDSRFVPEISRAYPRDNPRLSCCFRRWKPNLSLGQMGPEGEARGRKSFMCSKFMCRLCYLIEKMKTPQMVTLQLKIESARARKNPLKNMTMFLLTPCAGISRHKKQLNVHLQCCHLQCFGFARSKENQHCAN